MNKNLMNGKDMSYFVYSFLHHWHEGKIAERVWQIEKCGSEFCSNYAGPKRSILKSQRYAT